MDHRPDARDRAPRAEAARPRVLVADPIAPEGIDYLRRFAEVEVHRGLDSAALAAAITDCDALVVRSETRVTAAALEAGTRLRVVARAGVGVDNIDVEAATRRGIVVVNSPTGNIAAAAEHTIALLMALARHIPAAAAALRAGHWDRARYVGVELRGKVLGIIGLGKVGAEVARRAGEGGLGMRLLASDPYASPEHARKWNAELVPLEALLPAADFITLHTSLTAGTRGLLGAAELAQLKHGARIINCARGGIVDELALLEALDSGHLAGAALDVFSVEPPFKDATLARLIAHPTVVATPHLGASTEEAQVSVALDVVEQIEAVLQGGVARAAVNAPLILAETLKALEPWMSLVERLGRIYTQLHPGPLHRAALSVSGEIAEYDTRPLKAALIKGLLESVSEAHVNLVNAPVVAREWGLEVTENRTAASAEPYANLVSLRVNDDGGDAATGVLAATRAWGEERVVRVDRFATDFVPRGHVLMCRNVDRPGMIGRVGTVLGDAGVNIAHMDVGPVTEAMSGRERRPGGEALMILSLDNSVPPDALERIRQMPDITGTTVLTL